VQKLNIGQARKLNQIRLANQPTNLLPKGKEKTTLIGGEKGEKKFIEVSSKRNIKTRKSRPLFLGPN
jgi:hypothetical protein